MAEQQAQEKTEDATPRKLEKAREDGKIARSRELNSVAIVTFGAVAAIAMAPKVSSELIRLTASLFAHAGINEKPLPTVIGESIVEALFYVFPFLLILFVSGLLSSLGVGGVTFSTKVLRPKLERMNVLKGFGRMFSTQSLVELVKSIAKFVLIAGAAITVLSVFSQDLMMLGSLPINVAINEGAQYVGIALLVIGTVLVLVAAIDVPFQIAHHKKQLKMTKQEIKDELKDTEGKPEVKARLRALQQQVSRRQMMEEVPSADVVITNPEHFSVAIRYDLNQAGAPIMVAKGADLMAFRIREIADDHDVPIVPVPPLARAIFNTTEAGDEISAGLYLAVAQVLAYVYQLEQYRRGQVKNVPTLGVVEVPDEFGENSV